MKWTAGLHLRWFLVLVVASGLLVAACGRKGTPTPTRTATPAATASTTPTPGSTPTASPTSTGTADPTPAGTATPGGDASAEIRDYLAIAFPPGPGRDDVFFICVNCHPIQVIILGGTHDAAAWDSIRTRHDMGAFAWGRPPWEGRQTSQDALWEYLTVHFAPDSPPLPPMPQQLLEAGWQVY